MKTTIKSKKIKAGIVAAALIVLSAIGFVATNAIAEDPLSTGEGDIYISNVTVILNATDDWSGVDYTMYRIAYVPLGGGPGSQSTWIEYIDPFVVSGSGNYSIDYYSVDNDGNQEETKTTSFSIYADLVPPVTNCTLEGILKPPTPP